MKRINLWDKLNKPYWTPIGTMGWVAWAGILHTTGKDLIFYWIILFIAIACWFIRDFKEISKPN